MLVTPLALVRLSALISNYALACPAAQGNCIDTIFRTHLDLQEQVWFKLHRYHWLYLRNPEIRICCLLLIIKGFRMDLSWNVKQGELGLLGRGLWETNLLQHIIWIKAWYETQGCQWEVLRGPAWQIQRESTTHCISSLTALPVLGTATKAEVCRGEEMAKLSLWGWAGDVEETWGLGRWRSHSSDWGILKMSNSEVHML